MEKLAIIPEYKLRLHFLESFISFVRLFFLIQSKINTNELKLLKGRPAIQILLKLLWRLSWQIIVGQVILISAAFPNLFSSLLFSAGHGINVPGKWRKILELLIHHRFFCI